jgi:hypothetical protein
MEDDRRIERLKDALREAARLPLTEDEEALPALERVSPALEERLLAARPARAVATPAPVPWLRRLLAWLRGPEERAVPRWSLAVPALAVAAVALVLVRSPAGVGAVDFQPIAGTLPVAADGQLQLADPHEQPVHGKELRVQPKGPVTVVLRPRRADRGPFETAVYLRDGERLVLSELGLVQREVRGAPVFVLGGLVDELIGPRAAQDLVFVLARRGALPDIAALGAAPAAPGDDRPWQRFDLRLVVEGR